MKTHCCRRRRSGVVGGATFAALIALMPKCPMCIAAYLGLIGLSAASVDPRLIWLAAALFVALTTAALAHHFTKKEKSNEARNGIT